MIKNQKTVTLYEEFLCYDRKNGMDCPERVNCHDNKKL